MTRPAKARVSVIVPVYDGACYLPEAIRSILAQSYPPFEVIVVDDGSTDETAAILRSFGSALRVHHQENQGTAAARNRGVALAGGDLLAFLDQDDVWEPAKLAVQIAALDADARLDAVFGMVTQFHSPELGTDFRARVFCPPTPVPGYLPSAMLVRREAFLRVGPFTERWRLGEWTDWCARALDLGLGMRVLPECVARRRLHEGNKGLVLRSLRSEYPRILKALLDRRRAARR